MRCAVRGHRVAPAAWEPRGRPAHASAAAWPAFAGRGRMCAGVFDGRSAVRRVFGTACMRGRAHPIGQAVGAGAQRDVRATSMAGACEVESKRMDAGLPSSSRRAQARRTRSSRSVPRCASCAPVCLRMSALYSPLRSSSSTAKRSTSGCVARPCPCARRPGGPQALGAAVQG